MREVNIVIDTLDTDTVRVCEVNIVPDSALNTNDTGTNSTETAT